MHREQQERETSETAAGTVWRQRGRAWTRRTWPLAAVTLAVLLGVLLYQVLFPPPLPMAPQEIDARMAQAMASATPPPPRSAQVYQLILPSLVLIHTQNEDRPAEERYGVGSGVVINEAGDILTSLHVVAEASQIEVMFADGSQVTASIAATQPENDIAVLQANQMPGLIVPAILGSPGGMRVGDEAFAVGNPLGLAGSLSAGVISGFDRSIPLNESGQQLEGLIQFDAAVNPGNSGGPLLNQAGQVVGIVTALANPGDQNSFTGIGFAVPIQTASAAAGAPEY